MSEYEQDIFYDVSKLTLADKKALLVDAHRLSSNWWVDQLKSWSREHIDMSFDDILAQLEDEDHFVFIHRRGFKSQNDTPLPGEYVIETGFRTMSSPDLYLFITVDLKYLSELQITHKLTERL